MVYTHRWLGIAGGLLMLMWFASGIVMIYHRMPEVGRAERLERLDPIEPSLVRVGPGVAASTAGAAGGAFSLAMLGDRPVYRFGTTTIYADTGTPLDALSVEDALSVAADFAFEVSASVPFSYDALLEEPDQWTLQHRAFLPLHRVSLGDPEDTRLYVSSRSGEVVMRTTRSERAWSYAGAVLHWLYFTPLRVRSGLWAQTVIWLSVAGCLLTLSGLVWGALRFSPSRRHRPSGRTATRSPYKGLLKWHHYVGLVFGFFSFTWILSGGLSMDPWSWHPGTAPTAEQREGASLGPPSPDGISAELLRAGVAALGARAPVKEVRMVRFRGEPYLVGYREGPGAEPAASPVDASGSVVSRLVPALAPGTGAFERFPDADIIDAAVDAMPDVGIREMTWLDEYDAYYYDYDRSGTASLPVLRVRYADPRETALYFDPHLGVIVRKEERLTRLNRWLYRGLHSLDFPFLYGSRPLWDVVMIVLSLGGVALSATTLWPGLRRVARHARRIVGL